jgi:hypothetical protein
VALNERYIRSCKASSTLLPAFTKWQGAATPR